LTIGTASAHAATDFDAAGAAAAVTKTSIGLGAVTNDAQVKRTEMGSASGVATLDSGSHIPISQIPDALIGQVEYQGTWNPATNTPALPGASTVKGHYYITSFAGTYGGLSFDVGDWVISDGAQWDKVDNTDAVTMVAGRNGNITLTKGDVGLSNVDNTSDANKPVSTAQQTALNAKLDATAQAADVNPAGTSIAAALSGKVATALTVAGHALTADVVVSKGDVGLSNVDNTSDTNKPVSTAQATADSAVASAAAAAAAAATSLAFQADCSAWLQQSSLVIL
jgi:hypothetical protein